MTAEAPAIPHVRGHAHRPLLLVVGAAWALAVAAELTGIAGALHHDALIEGDLRPGAALLLFLLAWQAMVAAMMLPSSLPLLRMFDAVSRNQERPGRARGAFHAGYGAVWTGFGALAFAGDLTVHQAVEAVSWLSERQWLVGGSVLAVAGAFQFSDLKERCLAKCRHPGPYLLAHYERGPAAAFRLGFGHSLFCLGCCWALMLVMFAAGVAVLWWMAALTAVMVYEKTGRHGPALTPLVGVALLVLALLAYVHPDWLPVPLSS